MATRHLGADSATKACTHSPPFPVSRMPTRSAFASRRPEPAIIDWRAAASPLSCRRPRGCPGHRGAQV